MSRNEMHISVSMTANGLENDPGQRELKCSNAHMKKAVLKKSVYCNMNSEPIYLCDSTVCLELYRKCIPLVGEFLLQCEKYSSVHKCVTVSLKFNLKFQSLMGGRSLIGFTHINEATLLHLVCFCAARCST